jgi:arylformamidase
VDRAAAGDLPVHRLLTRAGVAILEGLDLSAATAGRYELIALPLRLLGVEASPVRALLRPLSDSR